MPAWSLGSCARRRRRRRHASFHPTLIFFLLTLPPVHGVYNAGTDPLGSCVRDPATEQSTTSTTPACCAWSLLGSCARSLARCSRRTTPTRLPWELCSWGELLLHESTSSTTPAWSLGSCVRRRRRHASFHPTLI